MGMVDELSVEDDAPLYGANYGLEPQEVQSKWTDILAWAGRGAPAEAARCAS